MRKKRPSTNTKVYVFLITLDLDSLKMNFGKLNRKILESKEAPRREIAMLATHTLYNFAEAINDAFGFMSDHCFGFYSNLGERSMYDSKEKYELFTHLEDVEHTPGARGVQRIKVSQVFKEIGKKMLFYFDYGDGWCFIVELKEIREPDFQIYYPVLLKKSTPNPQQYPPLE